MFIDQLKISNFRNITSTDYTFKNKTIIFHGNNGAGKTSILEALHFISSGKSFRKTKSKNLININSDHLTLFLKLHTGGTYHNISVRKDFNGKWSSKINSNKNPKQSSITTLLPVISLDPEVYRLIDYGPSFRRNYLDWIVFHVKHDYLILWKKVNKCIKQLNYLYKNGKDLLLIKLWEDSFVLYSNELNAIRNDIFNQIKPIIYKLNRYMQSDVNELTLDFKKGWKECNSLSEQTSEDSLRNLKYSQLHSGPHKMEIAVKINGIQASEILSRGQKKILSLTFYMAYIELLKKHSICPVICLDDFDAEIDTSKLLKASEFFKESKSQVFITTVDKDKIIKVFPDSELFHVEHVKG